MSPSNRRTVPSCSPLPHLDASALLPAGSAFRNRPQAANRTYIGVLSIKHTAGQHGS